MLVRTLMASATLGGGIILGSWFLSTPSNAPFSSADPAPVAAVAPRPNPPASTPTSTSVEIRQGAMQPAAATEDEPRLADKMIGVPIVEAEQSVIPGGFEPDAQPATQPDAGADAN